MITISIDLTKIDKAKIVEGKNGQKYYNLTVDNLKNPDRFGNTHCVYQSQSKEERAAKTAKNYLGNGKEWIFDNTPKAPPQTQDFEPTANQQSSDLPF